MYRRILVGIAASLAAAPLAAQQPRFETTAIAEAFTAAHPEFEPAPLSSLASPQSSLFLWPQDLNANGMFNAAWRRR